MSRSFPPLLLNPTRNCNIPTTAIPVSRVLISVNGKSHHKKLLLTLFFLSGVMSLSITFAIWSSEKDLSKGEVVILLHGLGRSNMAMWRLAGRLEDASYDIQQVGYSSINTTTKEVISEITKQIDTCCQKK